MFALKSDDLFEPNDLFEVKDFGRVSVYIFITVILFLQQKYLVKPYYQHDFYMFLKSQAVVCIISLKIIIQNAFISVMSGKLMQVVTY